MVTEAQKQQVWTRARKDFVFFCLAFLQVFDLEVSRWVPFKLRREQRRVVSIMEDLLSRGIPVRIVCLKARRLGFSSLFLAWAYWRCCFTSDFRSIFVAHLHKSAVEIALIAQGFRTHLPAFARGRLGSEPVEGGLRWKNASSLKVYTSRSDDVIKGAGPRMVHLSEVGSYDDKRVASSGEDFITATLAALEDVPDTYGIIESTGKGPRGSLYSRWHRAIELGDKSPWVPIFVSWAESEKYEVQTGGSTAAQLVLDSELRVAHETKDLSAFVRVAAELGYGKTWADRAVEFGLSPGQVLWAQRITELKYNGDCGRFDTDYPLTARLAFLSESSGVFPDATVEAWRDEELPPGTLWSGLLQAGPVGEKWTIEDAITPGDEWEIYELPTPGHEYIVSADVASGGGGKTDNSCLQVFCRHCRQQAAELYLNTIPPDELGRQAVRVALHYNDAFIIPERNNHGHVTVRTILDSGYPNLYRNSIGPATGYRPPESWVKEFGFDTSPSSRPRLIADLVEAIRDGDLRVWSKRSLSEMSTFVYDEAGKPDHQPGRKSDAVISLALSVHGHRFLPGIKVLPVVGGRVVSAGNLVQSWIDASEKKGRRSAVYGAR